MIYYFVSPDGDDLHVEAQPKGWFEKRNNPDMFTRRKLAVAEQKRRMKARIAELKELIGGLK